MLALRKLLYSLQNDLRSVVSSPAFGVKARSYINEKCSSDHQSWKVIAIWCFLWSL